LTSVPFELQWHICCNHVHSRACLQPGHECDCEVAKSLDPPQCLVRPMPLPAFFSTHFEITSFSFSVLYSPSSLVFLRPRPKNLRTLPNSHLGTLRIVRNMTCMPPQLLTTSHNSQRMAFGICFHSQFPGAFVGDRCVPCYIHIMVIRRLPLRHLSGAFDSTLHISEEATNASIAVPWAMISACGISSILGWGKQVQLGHVPSV
jgi:hypothetical protein